MRGCLEEVGPDGSLRWRLGLSTDDYVQHHDMVKLPNGNVLTIGMGKNITTDQAIELGREPRTLLPKTVTSGSTALSKSTR